MRITLVSPALLLAALLASGVATHAQAATAADCSSRSAAILASLREGRFADATRDFDPTMRSGLPTSKLQAVWAQALPPSRTSVHRRRRRPQARRWWKRRCTSPGPRC